MSTADFDLNALAIYNFEEAFADGDVADVSGNENLGYAGGDGELKEGKFGKAMVFNGADCYIMLPEEVLDCEQMTFAAWVNPESWRDWARVMDFGDGNTADAWLGFAGIERQLRFDLFSGGKSVTLLAPTPVPGKWTHIAFTFGDGNAKLYVNGKLAQSVPTPLKPTDLVKKGLYVGRSNWSADPLFTGLMDDVLVASKVYTPAQIGALLNGIVIKK